MHCSAWKKLLYPFGKRYQSDCIRIYPRYTLDKPGEAASRLFEVLRLCDEKHVETILAEEMPEKGIGACFMNRLKKLRQKELH